MFPVKRHSSLIQDFEGGHVLQRVSYILITFLILKRCSKAQSHCWKLQLGKRFALPPKSNYKSPPPIPLILTTSIKNFFITTEQGFCSIKENFSLTLNEISKIYYSTLNYIKSSSFTQDLCIEQKCINSPFIPPNYI